MEASKPKRVRRKYEQWQIDILENYFQQNWMFCEEDYIALAIKIKDTSMRVMHWLNNRRHRAKVTGEREGARAWKNRPVGQPKPPVQPVQTQKYQRKSKATPGPSNLVNEAPSDAIVPYELSLEVPLEECGAPVRYTIKISVPQEAFTKERDAMKRPRDESFEERSSKKIKAASSDSNNEVDEADVANILEELAKNVTDPASCSTSEENYGDDQFNIGEFSVFNEPDSSPQEILYPATVSYDGELSVKPRQEYSCVPNYQSAAQYLPTQSYSPANYYQQPAHAHYVEHSGCTTQPYYAAIYDQYPVGHHSEYLVQNQIFCNSYGFQPLLPPVYEQAANNMGYYQ